MDLAEEFEKKGFLGIGINSNVAGFRAENADWFTLAEDLNIALMQTVAAAMESAKTTSWAPEAVAARLLLRSCSMFQGIIILAERGMVVEGRTLTRSLIEDAICIAALHDNPSAFIEMLKDDHTASVRRRGGFILEENLSNAGNDLSKLKDVVANLKKAERLNIKKLAKQGPLTTLYLAYLQLSSDGAHTSAKALHRHIDGSAKRGGWNYKWGPGTQEENAATLYYAILAALPIGIGVTQMLKLTDLNALIGSIAHQFHIKKSPIGAPNERAEHV